MRLGHTGTNNETLRLFCFIVLYFRKYINQSINKHIYIYIHIYMEREKERKRHRG